MNAERSHPFLEVRDLRVYFSSPLGPVRAVDEVSLSLDAGETLALVGESGCGKSTLARAIMGLEVPSSGSILLEGKPLGALASPARRVRCRELQMVFQDPDASLNPRMTLSDSVSEPLALHERLTRREREARVCDLLERVGLDPAMRHRYPHELSGGQRQRVCIARALAVRPKLVICDEAVSALDVSIQAQILNLLADLRRTLELSYLFITHDLGVVRQIANRVAVMYLGQIVEIADAEQLFAAPQHPYTRALLAAVPRVDPEQGRERVHARGDVPSPARPPSGCRFHPRCAEVFDRCPREAPPLYAVRNGVSRCFLNESGTRGASECSDYSASP